MNEEFTYISFTAETCTDSINNHNYFENERSSPLSDDPTMTNSASEIISMGPEFYSPVNDNAFVDASGDINTAGATQTSKEMDSASLNTGLRSRGYANGFGESTKAYTGFGSGFLDRNGFSWLMEQTIEDDDEDYNTSILEELEIDLRDIYYKVRCVVFPLPSLGFKRSILSDSPDFWGPLMVVLLYAFVSLYGQISAVSWILTIWLCGSFFVFILTRVLGGDVSYGQCLGVIGYSLIPLVLTAVALIVFSSIYFVALFFKVVGVSWATYSAGTLLIQENLANKKPLVLYPVFLVYIYFYSVYSGV